ncbi:MAG: DUF2961 domain-containing protein [Candidatus Hydrogenedentes bacterium]|nr:DUF2961 domain-containing protein [Candidatus Hydrogenedentota bacterium]
MIALLITGIFCSAQPMLAAEAPRGSEALSNLSALPLFRAQTALVGTDSHDVTAGNNDGFDSLYSYLYKQGGEYVLFDEEGPGCVYVIRTIGHKGNLKVYLDGGETPVLTIPFLDLNKGARPPFLKPFVGWEEETHGSSWSYVPIPFAASCKLTTDEMEKPHFYNIFAHKYTPGTAVGSFVPDQKLDDAARVWQFPDKSWAPGETKKSGAKLALKPGEVGELLQRSGNGVVWSLRMRVADKDNLSARHLWLRGYWDELTLPAVDTPASSFFALGCPRALEGLAQADPAQFSTDKYVAGATRPQSLFVGQTGDGWLYCNFPMPFWKSARLEVLNTSLSDTVELEYEVVSSEQPYPMAAGYFHALWREERPVAPGEDYTVVSIGGRGHYVGCVLTMSSVYRDMPNQKDSYRGHLEGDARYYIDGNRTPLVASTGTEEYFNWGWYDLLKHDSVFAYATHGYPLHVAPRQDHSVMYRFHVGDVVPFQREFHFDLEHGPFCDWPAQYSGVAFLYRRSGIGLEFADELDIGDAASESAHTLACEGVVRMERRTLPYEGQYQQFQPQDTSSDRDGVVEDTGHVWDKQSSFRMSLAADNIGVKLRRRGYYGVGSEGDLGPKRKNPIFTPAQRVTVQVDGETVADWYVPAGHARDTWRDTEFEIPARYTQGKEQITVTLIAKNKTQWDAYTYWAFCYKAK